MGYPTRLLGEVADIIAGQSPPGSTYNDTGDGLPFFQGKGDFGEVSPRVRKWCSAPNKIAEVGDILISVRAPVGGTNTADQKSCIGRGLAALRGKHGVLDNRYLLHAFRVVEPILVAKGSGSTFQAVSRKDIASLEIPVPSMEEQRRIARLLDEADKIQRLRKEANEKARRILPALFIDMFGDPETNPMGWERLSLGETGSGVRYGMSVPPRESADGTPIIRATDISRGYIDGSKLMRVDTSTVPKSKNLELKASDVIVVRSGAYTGDIAQVTAQYAGCLAGYDLVVSPSKSVVGEYLESYLLLDQIQAGYFKPQSARSGQPHLNSKQLLATPLLVPPLELQDRFARQVRRLRECTVQRIAATQGLASMSGVLRSRLFAS